MYTLEDWQQGKIIALDKPLNWTSFDLVNKLKWKLKKQFKIKKIKVGHAGTLDPKAIGLLIVCTGKATKQISDIQNAPKTYIATLKLGARTISFDTETEEILHTKTEHITIENIKDILPKFTGEIWQKPPIFSAIKKDGKRLYDLAREGKTTEIEARKITIFSLEIIAFDLPFVKLNVHCSKGTYIRSLANDLGLELGCGAYLFALQRTAIGNYSLEKIDNDVMNFIFSEKESI